MTGRLLALITAGVMTVVFAVAALAALSGATSACTLPPSAGSASGYNTEQLHNAAIIVQAASRRGLPVRAAVIAVATALQESSLDNADQPTDHDSLGLFQQRPSQGWGTPQHLLNPEYAADKFYDKLLTVTNWQSLPLTVAAQAVQRSAYPDAYAKHEAAATAIVAQQYETAAGTLDCAGPGSAEPAPRNADGSWPAEHCTIRPDPTTGTGCTTPRLLYLVQQASAAGFPQPGCYRPSDHGEHPIGRACDWMMTSGGEATGSQKARGDMMAAWAVANADRLAIMYVIWFRMIWTPAHGWHAYNNPWGADDPSGWHTNHVHISVY
jgi:hypothetical protein